MQTIFLRYLFFPVLWLTGGAACFAQGSGGKLLRKNLNESGTHYLQAGANFQFWARYTHANPGSVVFAEPQTRIFDFSLRRYRVFAYGRLTDKLFFYTQVGDNNFSYLSERRTSVNILDAYTEYRFSEAFNLGIGKSGWTGLSRLSAPSTSKALAVDIPLFALATINTTDDYLRNLGLFAKGLLHRLNYRMAVFKPFAAQQGSSFSPVISENANFADNSPRVQLTGYFDWQFLEKESRTSSFFTGTWLGGKKLLNVGAGFKWQPDALWYLAAGDTVFANMQLLAADVFLDVPLSAANGMALTAYAGYFYYNFGPGYLRNVGVNNPATGVGAGAAFNGRGNAFPMIGTGHVWFSQGGLLLPKNWLQGCK